MLRDTARDAGVPMPLLIFHDVCWPYGRRDLYYAPERIPEEFRQPYDTRGILPERVELADEGGINQGYCNAVREGGPRNGVATAIDDFIAEHDRPLRRVVLPLWYGLALVAEQELLDARPELTALLDRLESADGRYELIELAESIRARETTQLSSRSVCRQNPSGPGRSPLRRPSQGRPARRALPGERGADRVPAGVHRGRRGAEREQAPEPRPPPEQADDQPRAGASRR